MTEIGDLDLVGLVDMLSGMCDTWNLTYTVRGATVSVWGGVDLERQRTINGVDTVDAMRRSVEYQVCAVHRKATDRVLYLLEQFAAAAPGHLDTAPWWAERSAGVATMIDSLTDTYRYWQGRLEAVIPGIEDPRALVDAEIVDDVSPASAVDG